MKILVGGSEYKLKFTEDIEDNACGFLDPTNGEIVVCSDMNQQLIKQTFWHEVVHAMLEESGNIKISNNEEIVDALARQIYCFFKNNNLEKIYKFLGE